MTTQIITRYVFNFSVAWNIELSRYTFVWLTFVGAAFVRKQESHIKIEILFNVVNKKTFPRSAKGRLDCKTDLHVCLFNCPDLVRVYPGQ